MTVKKALCKTTDSKSSFVHLLLVNFDTYKIYVVLWIITQNKCWNGSLPFIPIHFVIHMWREPSEKTKKKPTNQRAQKYLCAFVRLHPSSLANHSKKKMLCDIYIFLLHFCHNGHSHLFGLLIEGSIAIFII